MLITLVYLLLVLWVYWAGYHQWGYADYLPRDPTLLGIMLVIIGVAGLVYSL
jgi:hypothetical protein